MNEYPEITTWAEYDAACAKLSVDHANEREESETEIIRAIDVWLLQKALEARRSDEYMAKAIRNLPVWVKVTFALSHTRIGIIRNFGALP